MLPTPRSGSGQADQAFDDDSASIVERREARRERRRLAQASPGEGRNARPSAAGEGQAGALDGNAVVSPTRSQQPAPSRLSPPSAEQEVDMSRYGLVVESGDSPSPTVRPRRRMSGTVPQSPEQRGATTPSEHGSEVDSPIRRKVSRQDMHSSYDSLEGFAAGARASRRGSGFRKGTKDGKTSTAGKATASSIADVHVVGELVGASGFQQPMLFCRWQLLYEPSKSWRVVRGLQQGATHACCREVGEADMVVWEHPVEVHMQTHSLQGWPALLLMVYARDESTSRDSFVSYALVGLPNTPGLHKVSCQTWFAVESNRALGRSFFAWYTGLIPRLQDETFITDLRKREDAGPFICTVGAGEVHLRLNVLTRNLANVTHQGGESLAAALERLTTNILRASSQLANKSAALEEQRRGKETLTEGQKSVLEGRAERLASARAAVDARRRGDGASPAPSESSRASMRDQGARTSFRGFGGTRTSNTRLGSEEDAPSEASMERGYAGGGYTPPKDRYAERAARRARGNVARESEGREPSTSGTPAGEAEADGRRSSSRGSAGLASGLAPGGRDSGAAGAGIDATRGQSEDGGVSDAGAGGASGMSDAGEPGGGIANRAAQRAARRAAMRAPP